MAPSLERFDVYISFNQKDAEAVRHVVERLREEGFKVWLFDSLVIGGDSWAVEMREALERSASAAVFVGEYGLGPQQSEEVLVDIRKRAEASGKSFRVIPVLLPGAIPDKLPSFLRERLWIDFRAGLDDAGAFEKLLASLHASAPKDRAGDADEVAGESEPAPGEDSAAGAETSRGGRISLKKDDEITVGYLLEKPTTVGTHFNSEGREALPLAGAMAMSANRPVDSTLYLAALLSKAPHNPKHTGYSFLSSLQSQRSSETTSTAGPDVIELLRLTEFELIEIPIPSEASGKARVAEDLEALISRAAALAVRTSSANSVVRVRHVIGAILDPSGGGLSATNHLMKLGYDLESLRADFLSHVSTYHAGTHLAWADILSPEAAHGGAPAGPSTPAETPVVLPPPEGAEQESIQQASVSDQPSPRDTLGFAPYVKAIATFLTNEKTQPPLTLSVEGEWGSGKSSFMLQLAAELRADAHRRRRAALRQLIPGLRLERQSRFKRLQGLPWLRRFRVRRVLKKAPPIRCLTVDFNPWRHDKENALWASFALEFIRKLSQHMSPSERFRAHLRLLLRRFRWKDGWLVMLRLAFLLLITGALSVALFQLLRSDGPELLKAASDGDKDGAGLFGVIKASGVAGYVAVVLFFLSRFREFVGNPFALDLRKYVESPDYEGNIAFIEQFHEDFRKIVETYAGDNKVYVFIDDLDRCDVPKAADLMQAINLMISGGESHLVFVIGIDREKVAAGLAVKNEKLLPYLAHRPGGPAAKSGGQGAGQPSPDVAFGLEYGYNFIEKFIQIPFRVPQPAQMGVRTLLDFIAPLVEASGRADAEAAPGGAVKLTGRGVNDAAQLPKGADGNQDRGARNGDPARPAAGTAQDVEKATKILEQAGARTELFEADEEERKKGEEEKEGLMLLERGDSPTVRNIVLMVAPALDYNPRRIKQFINLFRLRAYIAYETGLFRRPRAGSPHKELTLEQLGKFVAIGLRWPRLLAELDEEHTLLGSLQQFATGEAEESDSRAVNNWRQRPELMSLLKFGCDGGRDPFEPGRAHDPDRYDLSSLNVEKLLQVSPRVKRDAPATPAQAAPPSSPDTAPGPALTRKVERGEAALS